MKYIGTTTSGNYIIELSPEHWNAVAINGVGYGENIGHAIKDYRKLNGLTQSQIAGRIGISRTYLSMIERGCATNYSHDVYTRLISEISKGTPRQP